jgi:hypothetical protein
MRPSHPVRQRCPARNQRVRCSFLRSLLFVLRLGTATRLTPIDSRAPFDHGSKEQTHKQSGQQSENSKSHKTRPRWRADESRRIQYTEDRIGMRLQITCHYKANKFCIYALGDVGVRVIKLHVENERLRLPRIVKGRRFCDRIDRLATKPASHLRFLKNELRMA